MNRSMTVWRLMRKSLFILVVIGLVAFDRPKLVKTKMADGITASIPKGWKPMDGFDFTERYPSVRAPLAAYTDPEKTADFSVNISATQWPDANGEMAQRFFKASLLNMFSQVTMIHEGILEVRGKKFIYFEFDSRVSGNKEDLSLRDPVLKYTFIQYLVEPGRTLVFSFSCFQRDKKQWQETAQAVMHSIKVK